MKNVSVPFRGLVISNEREEKSWIIGKSFRPLSGSRYFKFRWHLINLLSKCVSVPFRGLVISNEQTTPPLSEAVTPFPSPFGVSLFQIILGIPTEELEAFPSPFGVSLFQIMKKIIGKYEMDNNFPSPFGVSLFQICEKHLLEQETKSFRPLSGSRYFKYSAKRRSCTA